MVPALRGQSFRSATEFQFCDTSCFVCGYVSEDSNNQTSLCQEEIPTPPQKSVKHIIPKQMKLSAVGFQLPQKQQ